MSYAESDSRLSAAARNELQHAGSSPTAWSQRWFNDDTWHGDTCGCPDDRCTGQHHDADEDCGCLRALLEDLGAETASRCA